MDNVCLECECSEDPRNGHVYTSNPVVKLCTVHAAAPQLLSLVERAVAIADGKTLDRQFEDDCRSALEAINGRA